MNNALSKLNNVTKENLVPYFDIAKQNLRSAFEEMASDQVFKKQLNEYSNKIYSLSNLFESEINFLYLTFETKIFEIFKEELDFIFENDELKINDRPYYVDQTQLNQTFELYKQSLITNFENIIQIVPLCEMAHKGWHSFQKLKNKDNSNFFLSTDSAWGDFKKFVEKYHNDFTMQHVMKIKQYLNDYEKYSNKVDRPDLFNVTVTEWATKFDLK